MTIKHLPLCLLVCLPSCTPRAHRTPPDAPRWAPPPVERIISIRDGHTDAPVTLDALVRDLARAEVVFLGETHNDETTHRVELALYEALLERRNGHVVLAMEMFERDVQPELDAYLAGRIDEATFLAATRPWANYRTGYRYLIERARADRRPVVASNFPRPLVRRLAMEGPEVLEDLPADQRPWAPARLHPNTPEYWRRVDNAIRSHRGMFATADADDQRLYSTQTLWDNAMGESCVKALAAHPGAMVLHINGGFHSAYWDGTVRQLRLRRPTTRIKTVAITPVDHPAAAVLTGKPSADYVIFAEARSSDRDQGRWAVRAGRDIKYCIHRPADPASGPYPLLIWLGDDGLTADDGLELWTARLGDRAVIVAMDPPYRAVQADLSSGGRWYWPDSFPADLGAAHAAVHGAWSYVVRHFDVDPLRVCIAGEGTGATVVSSITLTTEDIDHDGVAIGPRRFARLKDLPLPLPDYRGPVAMPDKSLRVLATAADTSWWSGELGEYRDVGLDAELTEVAEDPWALETGYENAVRAGLGLPPAPLPEGPARQLVTAPTDTPRARHWARLLALHETAAGKPTAHGAVADASATPVDIRIDPQAFGAAEALPRCPGPFGGTTVLILPPDASSAIVDGWEALEAEDPIAASSRFHRLKVVRSVDDLPAVLQELLDGNRKNVLLIPATFCADIATMQRLRGQVSAFDDTMTLHWLPGLGGRLRRLDDE